VVELNDKGAVVALEDGVEGFCTARHLQKEDKSQVAVGDTMDFRVIEFNRDAKRILLSHLRTWEERKEVPAKEKPAKKEAQPELPKAEKTTTLGDIDALASLKASMESGADK
jgi:small subunit ribosomal protein S1